MSWIKELISKRRKKSVYDLMIWQRGIELALYIYEITALFPDSEKYGLISQMRRCAVSVPSNIAEGYGRFSPKDFANFLRIAKGSLCELDTQLIISWRLNFIEKDKFESLSDNIDNLSNIITAFINKCIEK